MTGASKRDFRFQSTPGLVTRRNANTLLSHEAVSITPGLVTRRNHGEFANPHHQSFNHPGLVTRRNHYSSSLVILSVSITPGSYQEKLYRILGSPTPVFQSLLSSYQEKRDGCRRNIRCFNPLWSSYQEKLTEVNNDI